MLIAHASVVQCFVVHVVQTRPTLFFAFSVEVGENGGSLSLMTSEVWSDEKWLGSRAQFRPETFPAVLRVHDVGGSDAGQYRCRVDFREAPTRNTLVNLTVIG